MHSNESNSTHMTISVCSDFRFVFHVYVSQSYTHRRWCVCSWMYYIPDKYPTAMCVLLVSVESKYFLCMQNECIDAKVIFGVAINNEFLLADILSKTNTIRRKTHTGESIFNNSLRANCSARPFTRFTSFLWFVIDDMAVAIFMDRRVQSHHHHRA